MNSIKGYKRKINVVHIIIGLNVGGAEMMLWRLINSQSSDGRVQHTVISLTDLGPVGELLRRNNVSVYTLGLKSLANLLQIFVKLQIRLLKLKPDVVHTWMYHADLIGGLAARLLGMKNIVWCVRSTNINIGSSITTRFIRKVCAWLSKLIPKVIIFGANRSLEAHVAIGYDPVITRVIHNGFDVPKKVVNGKHYAKLRKKLGFVARDRIIVSIGRYNQVKDYENFIEAAGRVVAKSPNVKILLVGNGLDNENEQLLSLIEKTGEKQKFSLVGQRKRPVNFLMLSDIFCLHSKSEGFPNVLGEAMSCGLPCISTDVGDAKLILGDDEWLVPPSTPDMLVDKLERLLEMSHEERAALGNIAKARIEKLFPMEKTSKEFLEIYKNLVLA